MLLFVQMNKYGNKNKAQNVHSFMNNLTKTPLKLKAVSQLFNNYNYYYIRLWDLRMG